MATTSSSVRSLLICYGSETGNAQDLAEEVNKLGRRLLFKTAVVPLDEINLGDLLRYTAVLVILSTTGQGDLPANAQKFWRRIRSTRLRASALTNLNFACFGLGDSSYPQFNWASRKLCNRLLQLDAKLLLDRGESDEQHPEGIEATFLPWVSSLRATLLDAFPLPEGQSPIADDVFLEPEYTVQTRPAEFVELNTNENLVTDPYDEKSRTDECLIATLAHRERMTPMRHWQDVQLFDFDLPHCDYEPADVMTVYPQNSREDVDIFLSLFDWEQQAEDRVRFVQAGSEGPSITPPFKAPHPTSKNGITLRELISNYLDIKSVPRRSFFATLVHFTEDEAHKERLLEFIDPQFIDELFDYTTRPRRSIIEVLQEFHSVKIPLKYVLSVVPLIRGRQFSIASGGLLKMGRNDYNRSRVQLLIAIVRYRTVIQRIREGLCTKYLANLPLGTRMPVTISKGGMKIELDRPSIMVGPGTGIAPLRSILHEQTSSKNCCDPRNMHNLLFFGGRNAAADFFFKDEWARLAGIATRPSLSVVTAFSRDQPSKIYVQDRIRAYSTQVFEKLQNGAVIYLSGSSGKMPQAVRQALIDVIQNESRVSQPEAEEYMDRLEKDGRYQQDTW